MPRKMLERLERIREKRAMREEHARAAQARAERMRLSARSRAEAPDKAHADGSQSGHGNQVRTPRHGGIVGRLALGALAAGLFMDGPRGFGLERASEPEPVVEPDLE